MVRIKICGITNTDDALRASELGAHALGFLFAESPRRVAPRAASRICRELPPLISRVGVFVNAPASEVEEIAGTCRLDVLQFHGHESADYCRSFARGPHRVMKAVRIGGRDDLAVLTEYDVDAFLLDTFVAGQLGGTGQTFDWELVREVAWRRPLVLSGGLTPENVGKAIELVRPYGVDVSSGVETEPGRKDPRLMKAFIEAALGADGAK